MRYLLVPYSYQKSYCTVKLALESLGSKQNIPCVYQSLSGCTAYREKKTRERHIVKSYRAGHQLESIINPIITTHPVEPVDLFRGSDDINTSVDFYHKPAIPEQSAAILVSDYWSMWAWAHHLMQKKVRFTLLGSPSDLNRFIQDCIELKVYGTSPRHGELFRYRTWGKLADAMSNNRSFVRIHELLQRGYSTKDWNTTQRWIQNSPTNGYTLSRLEVAKNREFDVVMLSPDAADMVWEADRNGGERVSLARASLYIGATRVRRKLIAPESLRDWIEEVTATSWSW